ncbi:hypothetical protein [Pseudomonas yamanorum]
MYKNKLGFKETPDSLHFSGFDDSKERTEAVQAAWAGAAGANEKNDQYAYTRWEVAQKRERGTPVGYVFAKSWALPDGVTNHEGLIPVESLKQYGSYPLLG